MFNFKSFIITFIKSTLSIHLYQPPSGVCTFFFSFTVPHTILCTEISVWSILVKWATLSSPLHRTPLKQPHCPCCLVANCVQFYDPTHYSPLGSSVCLISQTRILEVGCHFLLQQRIFWPRDWTSISCLVGVFFTTEPHWKLLKQPYLYSNPNSFTFSFTCALVTGAINSELQQRSLDEWSYNSFLQKNFN